MGCEYSQLSLEADTLGTKATVRFREVSALERVPLQRDKCNSAGSGPDLLSGLESVRWERVDSIHFLLIFRHPSLHNYHMHVYLLEKGLMIVTFVLFQYSGFKGKIYATDPTIQIGR